MKQSLLNLLFLPPPGDYINEEIKDLPEYGDESIITDNVKCKRFKIRYQDAYIDQIELTAQDSLNYDITLIHCNGKRRTYHNYISEFVDIIVKNPNWKVVLFNYRGIWPSTGNILNTHQFIEDSYQVIEKYIDTNLVITGHSMGGAIATYAAAKYNLPLCSDRSFKKLSDVCLGHLKNFYLGFSFPAVKRLINYFELEMDAEEQIKKVSCKLIIDIYNNEYQQFEDPIITKYGSMSSSSIISNNEKVFCYLPKKSKCCFKPNYHNIPWKDLMITNQEIPLESGIINFITKLVKQENNEDVIYPPPFISNTASELSGESHEKFE